MEDLEVVCVCIISSKYTETKTVSQGYLKVCLVETMVSTLTTDKCILEHLC